MAETVLSTSMRVDVVGGHRAGEPGLAEEPGDEVGEAHSTVPTSSSRATSAGAVLGDQAAEDLGRPVHDAAEAPRWRPPARCRTPPTW